MTNKDVAKMLNWLEKYYPTMNDIHKEKGQLQDKIKAWHDMLYVVKSEDAARILKLFVKQSNYPPTIADIIRPWQKYNSGKDMDEWNKKHGRVRNEKGGTGK